MAKIKFDINFRPQIESGEYKVETFSGYPVTIYRWDFDDGARTPIMGSYIFEDSKEYVGAWNEEGHFDLMSPNDLDLFIITPEQELSEFEKAVEDLCWKVGIGEYVYTDDIIKKKATELLDLARKELREELKTHEDHKDSFIGLAISSAYERGKAEALKGLSRWKKADRHCFVGPSLMYDKLGFYESSTAKPGCLFISIEDLKKLPGFKED